MPVSRIKIEGLSQGTVELLQSIQHNLVMDDGPNVMAAEGALNGLLGGKGLSKTTAVKSINYVLSALEGRTTMRPGRENLALQHAALYLVRDQPENAQQAIAEIKAGAENAGLELEPKRKR